MSEIAASHEIRLRVDVDHPTLAPLDVGRLAAPVLLLGVPTTLRLAFFAAGELADVSGVSGVRVEIKAAGSGIGPNGATNPPAQDADALAAPDPVTELDADLELADWRAGDGQHVEVEFSAAQMGFDYPTKGRAWLIVALEHEDAAGVWRVVSSAPCTIVKSGFAQPA